MLDELRQVLMRLHHSGLSSSRAACDLKELHSRYLWELQRVAASREHPHVMRILAEEAAEGLAGRMEALGIVEENRLFEAPAYWRRYLEAVRSGEVLGVEYARYLGAVKLTDFFLQQSFLDENSGLDYKTMRYAYALSNDPLPNWFIPENVLGYLEEIVTACGFLWFSVVDFAEAVLMQKGA